MDWLMVIGTGVGVEQGLFALLICIAIRMVEE